MDKFKKVKVIGNVIGYNRYALSKKETYNVQFPDMTIAELKRYQFEDADAYHTDGKRLCLRNVLARLHELPEHDRGVWLKGIMDEFELGFSHAKWREGYAQGKFDGAIEREKVVVPQFVADFISEQKKLGYTLSCSIDASMSDRVAEWYWNNFGLFASAWLDGYEVEKEKRYLVKIKGDIKENTLVYGEILERYFFTKNFTLGDAIYYHTRKELEEAGFGWVFSCEGIEIEEVE